MSEVLRGYIRVAVANIIRVFPSWYPYLLGWTGVTVVHKFGRNDAVGTTVVPVCSGGNYRMPVTGSTVTLKAISDDINDTAAGSGARTLEVQYLDSTGAMQTGTLTMNGTSESSDSLTDVWRVFRFFVKTSGTYADQSAGSHAGRLRLQVSGGGDVWAEIADNTDYARGQSQIAAYTVPLGEEAWVKNIQITSSTARTGNVWFLQRQDADDGTPPVSAMRLIAEWDGVSGQFVIDKDLHFGPFPALTDLIFLANTSSATASISIDFEIHKIPA